MKGSFFAAAAVAALAACSSHPSDNGPAPSNAAPASESSRDAPPQTAPLERPANSY